MMLFQKPAVAFPLSSVAAHHQRRHSSVSPLVVVQQTRTPGILSLSRPQPQQPLHHLQLHQQRQVRAPKPKPASVQNRGAAKAAQLQQTKQLPIVEKVPPSSESKPVRGRLSPEKKKTTKRSISPMVTNESQQRRLPNRQPSPPYQPSSQAEGPIKLTAHSTSNSFDPFLMSSDSESGSISDSNSSTKLSTPPRIRNTPTLSPRPSGGLARRRQPATAVQAPSSPTPASKSIPIQRKSHSPHASISRSDPAPSHMSLVRPIASRAHTEEPTFRVCNDLNDDEFDRPSTPSPTRVSANTFALYNDGPRTAPLSSSFGFPFGGYANHVPSTGSASAGSTPAPSNRSHVHKRSDSEAILGSHPGSSDEFQALLGMLAKKNGDGMSPGFYASSMFQNSPSPEDLPNPEFGALF